MNPAIASLLALVPTVFTDHKVTFDTDGEPLLVVTIVKKADGSVTATVEPDVNATEKLNELLSEDPMNFEPGKTYEIKFTEDNFDCFVDGESVDPEDHPPLADFLNRFCSQFYEMAEDLSKTMNLFPPADDLAKAVNHSIKQQLVHFLLDGNVEAFMTGPTTFVMVCACEAEMAKQEKLPEPPAELMEMTGILGEALGINPEDIINSRNTALKEAREEWAAARAKVTDWRNIVTVAPMGHEHPHFGLFTTIITAAAQTFLTPDLVDTKRQAILAKVRPVVTAAKAD